MQEVKIKQGFLGNATAPRHPSAATTLNQLRAKLRKNREFLNQFSVAK
jgi:hypothetical protein